MARLKSAAGSFSPGALALSALGLPPLEYLKFAVQGKPIPKGRPRVVGRGRNRHTYTPKRTLDWEDKVRGAAIQAAKGACFPKGMHLSVSIQLEGDGAIVEIRPSPFLRLQGDLDNLAKAILDGIQRHRNEPGVIEDDRYVSELHVYGRTHGPARERRVRKAGTSE